MACFHTKPCFYDEFGQRLEEWQHTKPALGYTASFKTRLTSLEAQSYRQQAAGLTSWVDSGTRVSGRLGNHGTSTPLCKTLVPTKELARGTRHPSENHQPHLQRQPAPRWASNWAKPALISTGAASNTAHGWTSPAWALACTREAAAVNSQFALCSANGAFYVHKGCENEAHSLHRAHT
eukprot:1157740-Pelagomonas_calceolata.AAC.3